MEMGALLASGETKTRLDFKPEQVSMLLLSLHWDQFAAPTGILAVHSGNTGIQHRVWTRTRVQIHLFNYLIN